ncbi:MAG TPA: HlyD family type I secretion periplasmic adaptor subunit [Amphiplicatus sp.]|nr:HlyD family type I secretion periplasmic adaptor subunit [Amphiplicatus sp.]MCB9956362.1 HlyD family type I secretion periplasmic adaptor subunit [Caulobacterales bacterium]HOP19792.1 HlyD family type I secretion periplasmic adaptor subunit [Amphiplicatus sp.]HRX38657.1 HlyD family type I secretion periplasmic adaptor subunit [Parvularculaceae bacterium]
MTATAALSGVRNAVAGRQRDDLRYLASSIELEEPTRLKSLGGVTYAVSGLVAAFLLWASVANIHAVTRTSGEVAPSGSLRIVQHQVGGVIREILVQEGQLVDEGETLVLLQGDGVVEDLQQAREKQLALRAREERLRAFLDDREPDFSQLKSAQLGYVEEQRNTFLSMQAAINEERKVLEQQRSQKYQAYSALKEQLSTVERNREITQKIYDSRKELVKEGYYPRVQFLETERNLNELIGAELQLKRDIELAQTALAEYDQRLELQGAKSRDEAYVALDSITAELAQNREVVEKLENRLRSLAVTSPVRGLVKSMSVNSVGGVVGPGQVIAEVVPLDEELIVEIKISPKDIGNIQAGRAVDVKFSAYDYSQFGSIRGTLDYVSATTFSGPGGERFYRGKVKLDKNYVGDDPDHNIIIPGMTVMADIILGDRTLLAHLLSPAQKIAGGAFKE